MMEKEMKELLWNEYINSMTIMEQQKKNLKDIGILLFEDVAFLYEIYPLIGEKDVSCRSEKSQVIFENEETLYILRKENCGIFLNIEEMKKLIMDMITLFEEILPLGSIVDLKKDKLSEEMDISEVENFRVVITKRFIGVGDECFYPYGAVVYPLAMGDKIISFTPALIDKVVFRGYEDNVEEAFVFEAKYQLVIEQKRKSVGFATRQEMMELTKALKKYEVKDE